MRVVAITACCAGCNAILGLDPTSVADDGVGDGGGTGWSAPRTLAILATDAIEDDPAMSPDGLELYGAVTSPVDGTKDIVRAVRGSIADDWQTAAPATELNSTTGTDATPRLGNDGRSIWIATDRYKNLDIFQGSRLDAAPGTAWSNLGVLPLPLSSAGGDHGATPCADATRFVVASTREGPDHDVYEAIGANAVYAIATEQEELSPFITEDCLTLYFAADYLGDQDLFVVTRGSVDGAWGEPARIDALSETGFDEQDPWLTADGRRMLFASDREGGWDVWEATR